MATPGRNAGLAVDPEVQTADAVEGSGFEALTALLRDEAFRVEFFQAVRLLQRTEQGRSPVGYFLAPGSEAVRFSALTTLAFPASQIYDLRRREDGQAELVVQFMGLCAAVTILPHAYTEHLLLLLKNKDTAMAEFFDLFNHRMISLFYRGWEKYRFFIGYEAGQQDGMTPRLMDLLGLGTAGMKARSSLPDRAYLAYSGLLGRHARTAGALKQILEDFFQVATSVEQFAGTWRALPAQNKSILEGTNRASERLGLGTVIGSEVWDHHGRIRISIGPMDFDQYVSFLPGHAAHKDLQAWVKFFSSGQYEAEVQLILHRDEAPRCVLGLRSEEGPRLGLVSWLSTKALNRDPGDAVFLLA